MNPRRLVQFTGFSLILLSGGFIAYPTLTTGKPYTVGEVNTSAPTLGRSGQTLTLVADLACPHCAEFDIVKGKHLEQQARAGTMKLRYLLIARQDGGDVVDTAALCVFAQNPEAFWEYKRALYALDTHNETAVTRAAQSLDLNHSTFRGCVRGQSHVPTLEHNERVVRDLGIQGTPTLVAGTMAYPNPSTAVVMEVAGE